MSRNSSALALLTVLVSAQLPAAPITGAWYLSNAGEAQSTVVFAFLADGRFMLIEDGNPAADPSGEDGLEKGTYTWNPATGAFSRNTLINTNGEWGFCPAPSGTVSPECTSGPPQTTITSDGNFLTVSVPGEPELVTPTRLYDPAKAIVGAWFFSTGPLLTDLTVVAFLPDGRVMAGIDPPSAGFIEFGTYTWDPVTGALTTAIASSNAPPALSLNLPSFTSANIVNGQLLLSSRAGELTLTNAAVPEPATILLTAIGLGGLLLRRPTGMRRSASSRKRDRSPE